MKKLELAITIDCNDFTKEVKEELYDGGIDTNYIYNLVTFWKWEKAREHYPKFQDWLIKTYGEEIKQYNKFMLVSE